MSFEEREGQKVVVKRAKPTTGFHEYLLLYTYVMISILLGHPSAPPNANNISKNEGFEMRSVLSRLGIPTPRLVSMSYNELVEEFIEGGDLYRAIAYGASPELAACAGTLTGRLHRAGYVFTDNKAQNFLVRGGSLLRTDLGFVQKSNSVYAMSMDVGSFLGSVMDLPVYCDIEKAFFEGYRLETGHNFPYLSIVIRNLLSVGFASDTKITLKNMLVNTGNLVSA